MASDRKDHYTFCAARFQHLDGQIKAIIDQLADMYYGSST